MRKVLLFGNSGSGKSTLARELCLEHGLAHLDLDTIAWKPGSPPVRRRLEDSESVMKDFIGEHRGWVIEGCYADLLERAAPHATEMVFLNLPVEDCIENARARPWEPHKYPSKEAQDRNLEMLIDWIGDYPYRTDTFSRSAHEALFAAFPGSKVMYTGNSRAAKD